MHLSKYSENYRQGCQTFGEYSGVFLKTVTRYFGLNTTRVDVVFNRYLGVSSIKSITRCKRVAKKKPIRKHIDGPDVPLPQTWNQFIALDMNKANLAQFLSDALMKRGKDLQHTYELVTGGGFPDQLCAASTHMRLNVNHEEADTRMILHACEAVSNGYERVLVISDDTDVMLLLLHSLSSVETWMVSGTTKKRKCYPIHAIGHTLSNVIRDPDKRQPPQLPCTYRLRYDIIVPWQEVQLESIRRQPSPCTRSRTTGCNSAS